MCLVPQHIVALTYGITGLTLGIRLNKYQRGNKEPGWLFAPWPVNDAYPPSARRLLRVVRVWAALWPIVLLAFFLLPARCL